MDFGRLITAMVTPFDQSYHIHWDETEKLINYLIDVQKTDSIVVCGTTGESPTLTEQETLELIEFTVNKVDGRCKVIAGTGSNNTHHAMELSKKAEELGVDGLLQVAPYYNRPTQEGLYEHFAAIAYATQLPIMLYNIPKRTGINIHAATTIRLAAIGNIVASKESHSDLDHITTIIANTDSSFKIYSGDDHLTLPMMAIGGYGVVSVASHVIGNEMNQMIAAFLEGKVDEAFRLHHQLHPIFKGLFLCPNPVLVKYALTLHGIEAGGVRLPLVKATEEEETFVKNLFVPTKTDSNE